MTKALPAAEPMRREPEKFRIIKIARAQNKTVPARFFIAYFTPPNRLSKWALACRGSGKTASSSNK